MDKPVTKRELHQALEPYATKQDLREALEPYATKQDLRVALKPYPTREEMQQGFAEMREYVKQQLQLVVDMLVLHMNKMEDRIAASVWSGLEMRVGAAVGAVEDKLVPRIKRLDDKVFPPKRQRRR